MDHDSYDEGLVHGHRWATEPTMPRLGATIVLGGFDDTALVDGATTSASAAVDEYDDGLVHGHAWAVQSLDRERRVTGCGSAGVMEQPDRTVQGYRR